MAAGPTQLLRGRLDGDGLEHRLYQEPLEFDSLLVPLFLERLVRRRNPHERLLSEAVGEGGLNSMELDIELLAPPAVAGLVQVSADVEIDKALPARLDAADLLADRMTSPSVCSG